MASYVRKSLVTVFAGAAFITGVASPASAQPVDQDGLVNVNIGDVTVTDTVDVAASLAVAACDLVDVGAVAVGVLARATAVDTSGRSQTICRTDQGPVTITNN
jgi:hypothetical protein